MWFYMESLNFVPTAVRRLIGGRDEGGIHFPDGIDSSEHRRGGSLRREPRLSKSNLLDSGGSAQRLRDVLIYPQQHRAAVYIKSYPKPTSKQSNCI